LLARPETTTDRKTVIRINANDMKKNLTMLLTTLALAGALSAGLTIAGAQTSAPTTPSGGSPELQRKGNERHPAIHHAIRALEEAKHDLERADHDFGGHRKEALEECEKAIAQLKVALQYDKK
jgi:hypothetical protein